MRLIKAGTTTIYTCGCRTMGGFVFNAQGGPADVDKMSGHTLSGTVLMADGPCKECAKKQEEKKR